MRADLHMHSVFSDGEKTPAELIALAKAAGVELLSITDHDTLSDLDQNAALAKEAGLCYVPGIEFTTFGGEQIHILGYRFAATPAFRAKIQEIVDQRAVRNRKILERLEKVGVHLEESEIERNASGFYGTMHIVRAMVRAGYVPSYMEGMRRFFATDGPGFVGAFRISPEEAVRVIREAGGVPVLAHPGKMKFLDFSEQEKLVLRLKECGLLGIECFYPSHTVKQTEEYAHLADRLSLLKTVGSDFHGVDRPEHVGVPAHDLGAQEVALLCGKTD